MANNLQIDLPLNPVLDVGKFNVLLNELKTAMGPLGKDIQPIDEAKYKAAIQSAKKSVDELTSAEKKAGDEIKEVEKKAKQAGDAFGKAFQFNQIIQAAGTLSNTFTSLSEPLLALDKNVRNIGTLGVQNFAEIQEALLKQQQLTGRDAVAQADALYDAVSAGSVVIKDGQLNIKEALSFLDTSSKLAKAGLTDVKATTNVLTSVINAYGDSVSKAGNYSDTLFGAVKLGKTTVPELANSLYNVVPAAAQAGVSFDQVVAAVATLTKQGVPTAQATTQIRQSIVELMKPGAALQTVMTKAGVSLESLKKEGLQQSMVKIGNAMSEMGLKASQVFSSVEAAGAAALLNTKDISGQIISLADIEYINTSAVGSTQKAFDIQKAGIESQTKSLSLKIKGFVTGALGEFDKLTGGLGSLSLLSFPGISSLVTTLAGLNMIIPGGLLGGLKSLGTSILGLIPSFTTAGAAGTAAGASVVAAWLPVIGMVAGIAAVGVGLYALAGGFDKTSASKLKDTEETIKNLEANKKANLEAQEREKEIAKLIQTYEKLIQSNDGSAASEKRLDEIREKLNERYPETINLTKSHADNLEAIKKETGLVNQGFESLDENSKKLIIEFEKLGKKEKLSAEEKKKLQSVTAELNNLYPDVKASTDDYAGSLERLKNQAGGVTNEMNKLRSEFNAMLAETSELAIIQARQQRDALKDEAMKAFTDVGDIAFSESDRAARQLVHNFYLELVKINDPSKIAELSRKFRETAKGSVKAMDFFGIAMTEQKIDKQGIDKASAYIIQLASAQENLLQKARDKQKAAITQTNKDMTDGLNETGSSVQENFNKLKADWEAEIITIEQVKGNIKILRNQLNQDITAGKISAEMGRKLSDELIQFEREAKKEARGGTTAAEKEADKRKKIDEGLIDFLIKKRTDGYKALQDLEGKSGQDRIDALQRIRIDAENDEKLEGTKRLNTLLDLDRQIHAERLKLEIEAIETKNNEIKNKEQEAFIKRLGDVDGNAELFSKYQMLYGEITAEEELSTEEKNQKLLDLNKDYLNKLLSNEKINADTRKQFLEVFNITLANLDKKAIAEKVSAEKKAAAEIYKIEAETAKRIREERLKEQYEARLQNINQIKDKAIREREIAILEAEKTYNEEVKLAKDSQNLKLDALIKFQQAKLQAEQTYLDKTTDIYTKSAITFGDILNQQLAAFKPPDNANEDAERLKKEIDALSKEEQAARISYKKKEISGKELQDKLLSFAKQRHEKEVEMDKLRVDLGKSSLQVLGAAFGQYIDAMGAQMTKHIENFQSLTGIQVTIDKDAKEAQQKAEKAKNEGNIEDYNKYNKQYEDLNIARAANEEKTQSAIQGAYITTAAVVGSSLGKLAADGKLTWKSLVLSALDGLQAMVPIITAQIFGLYSASPNPVNVFGLGVPGAVAAAAASIALSAMVQVAKAGVSKYFWQGAVNIQGPGTSTSDDIPAMLSVGESVINARATKVPGHIPLFNWINQNQQSAAVYYAKFKPLEVLSLMDPELLARQSRFIQLHVVENVGSLEMIKSLKEQNNYLKQQNKILIEKFDNLEKIILNSDKLTRRTIQDTGEGSIKVQGELKASGGDLVKIFNEENYRMIKRRGS